VVHLRAGAVLLDGLRPHGFGLDRGRRVWDEASTGGPGERGDSGEVWRRTLGLWSWVGLGILDWGGAGIYTGEEWVGGGRLPVGVRGDLRRGFS
jgi:hypothetical protein